MIKAYIQKSHNNLMAHLFNYILTISCEWMFSFRTRITIVVCLLCWHTENSAGNLYGWIALCFAQFVWLPHINCDFLCYRLKYSSQSPFGALLTMQFQHICNTKIKQKTNKFLFLYFFAVHSLARTSQKISEAGGSQFTYITTKIMHTNCERNYRCYCYALMKYMSTGLKRIKSTVLSIL